MSYEDAIAEIRDRVRGYFDDAPIPDNEPAKHTIVRETCVIAKAHGFTADEIEHYALIEYGQPSIAVCSVEQLRDLRRRLDSISLRSAMRARIAVECMRVGLGALV